MLQQDTIAGGQTVASNTQQQHAATHALTPADVIAALPAGATPAQQDSAVQAHFKPAPPHFGDRPDTLHMPGTDIGRSIYDTSLPGYDDMSAFPGDTLAYEGKGTAGYGVAGDPVPYIVRNDDMITSMLIVSFVMVAVALSNSRRFIARQFKSLIYPLREHSQAVAETSAEARFQMFLVLHTCLQLSIIQYFYTLTYIGDTFTLGSQYQLIGIYFAMFAGYFTAKGVLYSAVDTVFFGGGNAMRKLESLLFITATEGVLLLPVVLLQVFFDLAMENVVIYFICVLILVKILTFYKCNAIFLRRPCGFLRIILYFCTLEIVPMAAFWGALTLTGNHLKINF